MSENTTTLKYTGNVKIKYLINGKEVAYRTHNEGLNAMFKYLCKLLTGNVNNIASECPSIADVRCVYRDYETGGQIMTSCLYNTLLLSDKEYFYDMTLQSWAARFSISLSYSMLNFDIINDHLEDTFYIYIASQSGNDFARLVLDDEEIRLTDIVPGTQALIEWTMLVQNA